MLLSPVDVCTCEGASDGCSVLYCGWHLCESAAHTHTHTHTHTLLTHHSPTCSQSFNEHHLRRSLKTLISYASNDHEMIETTFPLQVRVTAPPYTRRLQAMVYIWCYSTGEGAVPEPASDPAGYSQDAGISGCGFIGLVPVATDQFPFLSSLALSLSHSC